MILNKKYIIKLFVISVFILIMIPVCAQEVVNEEWSFVSVPDFLNKDTEFPHPGFEDGLNFFLKSIKNEGCEFVLVPGDLINGRWPDKLEPTKEAILKSSDIYYTAWKKRFEHHSLKYFVAIGDHEIGDNPWPKNKAELVPLFKEQFIKHFQLPNNGPKDFQGTSYYFTHNEALFVVLDVFTKGSGEEGEIVADVNGKHLKWVNKVLKKHKDSEFKIVVGHTPILSPVRTLNSSGMLFQNGEKSGLWKVMQKNNVDLYLCGEVHAITCTEKNGINQIAHGSLFGWNPTLNYLLVEISNHSLKATLKEIDNIPIRGGAKSLGITITEESMKEGFKTIGTLIINKNNKVVTMGKSGVFK
ncbi:MAG: metallophosphoesterase [Prolixibacteraceae bacterium]|jgi:hypothetical protein|nr:metallophosphoesterase [Prolixibacteraceae bacterium]